jgi:hypothetical protein
MKSATLPSFWDKYSSLDDNIRHKSRKAFQLWEQNPFLLATDETRIFTDRVVGWVEERNPT